MKPSSKYLVNVLVIGFVTLLLVSIPLFWVRKICQSIFYENLVVGREGKIEISPSGIVPEEIENDHVIQHSKISAYIGDGVVYHGLGIFQDVFKEGLQADRTRELGVGFGKKKIYLAYPSLHPHWSSSGLYKIIYFDKNLGQFVLCDIQKEVAEDREKWKKTVYLVSVHSILEN